MKYRLFVMAATLLCGCGAAYAGPPIPYPTIFAPGTREELPYLAKIAGATVNGNTRHAENGQFWFYGFPVAPRAQCRLELLLEGGPDAPPPNIGVLDQNAKPLPIRLERDPTGLLAVLWTVPANWPLGGRMSVVLSARPAPFTLKLVRFSQVEPDSNRDGLPDNVVALLRQGLPPTARLVVRPAPDSPFTITQTGLPPNPVLDLQTDAVFAYTSDASVIRSWKRRGYTTWTMGGAREGKEYAEKHPDELQTEANGNAITVEGSHYLTPTLNRINIERGYYAQALANGSDGVCPEEPEYWARAGYEGAFKAAWQQRYGTPWKSPASSVDARWNAGRLMAEMETEHIAGLLQEALRRKPNARRLVALHSPLNYAQWGIVAPQYRITQLAPVEEVIGQVWTGTARTPVRYAGLRRDMTFSLAYLEYSSLAQLLRGTNKRLWFLLDPLEDDLTRAQADYESHYAQTLIAALLFPDVTRYEVMPWPDRVYGRVPATYATTVNSVNAALQEMHTQTAASGNALSGSNGIGVFVSDSMQWQREAPAPSDFDGVFGLSLPLLQRGVPVQMVSLDRASEPNYLKSFKTLLLSYDFQKPPDARTQEALKEWVKRGGSLLFFGGSDPYNAVADSWWRKEKRNTPQDDLWARMEIDTGGAAVSRQAFQGDTNRYEPLLKGDGKEHNLRNRRNYTFDLTRFAQKTGSVAVRFSDITPSDGWGPYVVSVELRVGGKIAAAFRAGSDIENRFITSDHDSQFNGEGRYADGSAFWVYQFDNLPRNQTITITIDMGNGFAVDAASAQPDYGHTLIGNREEGALVRSFPRLRVGANYPITFYPGIDEATPSKSAPQRGQRPTGAKTGAANGEGKNAPTILYTLRSGGTPIWVQTVGKGIVVYVGVAPGFFSSSERSAGLLRGLTQYAHQRAGGVYREPGFLKLRRGRYTIVHTFGESTTVAGRTIDLLSPTLAVAAERVIPPRSLALLIDAPTSAGPQIGFVSGRVQAQIESGRATTFFVRGPAETAGTARLLANGRRVAGVRAMDRIGRPVSADFRVEGSTVLVRYPNHPDGVVVRIGWE